MKRLIRKRVGRPRPTYNSFSSFCSFKLRMTGKHRARRRKQRQRHVTLGHAWTPGVPFPNTVFELVALYLTVWDIDTLMGHAPYASALINIWNLLCRREGKRLGIRIRPEMRTRLMAFEKSGQNYCTTCKRLRADARETVCGHRACITCVAFCCFCDSAACRTCLTKCRCGLYCSFVFPSIPFLM